jgi:hypothetical protein
LIGAWTKGRDDTGSTDGSIEQIDVDASIVAKKTSGIIDAAESPDETLSVKIFVTVSSCRIRCGSLSATLLIGAGLRIDRSTGGEQIVEAGWNKNSADNVKDSVGRRSIIDNHGLSRIEHNGSVVGDRDLFSGDRSESTG